MQNKSLKDNELYDMIDWLTYRSYVWNRKQSPDIEPHRWSLLYPNAEELEKIYKHYEGEQNGNN